MRSDTSSTRRLSVRLPASAASSLGLAAAACRLDEEVGVVEGHRGLAREGLRETQLLGIEDVIGVGADHERTDHALANDERHRETAPVAGLLDTRAHLGGQHDARIGAHVARGDERALAQRETDQPGAGRDHERAVRNGAGIARHGHADQIARSLVDTEEDRRRGPEQRLRAVHDAAGDALGIERLRE